MSYTPSDPRKMSFETQSTDDESVAELRAKLESLKAKIAAGMLAEEPKEQP